MKKIPLEILSLYLPYGVKAKFKYANDKKCKQYVIDTVTAVYDDGTIYCGNADNGMPDEFKLVLKPITALKRENFYPNEINSIEMVSLNKLHAVALGFLTIKKLLKQHIDIFGLIEQGLAEENKLSTTVKGKG